MKRFLILLLLIIPVIANAQEGNNNKKHYSHSIGIAGSMMSSFGLSYQYRFDLKNAVEITGMVFMSSQEDNDYEYENDDFVASIGAEYHRLLIDKKWVDLSFMAGCGYGLFDNYSKEESIFTGSGIVIESSTLAHRLKFDIDLGFTYHYTFEDDNDTSTFFGVAIGAGIYYCF